MGDWEMMSFRQCGKMSVISEVVMDFVLIHLAGGSGNSPTLSPAGEEANSYEFRHVKAWPPKGDTRIAQPVKACEHARK